ncbi:MAG: class I SAM-dependent methyltransferase [Xanthomonadales bacterium]|nr:class I SAM-dependent methyltransferase [Xanthomonadales bacterium]
MRTVLLLMAWMVSAIPGQAGELSLVAQLERAANGEHRADDQIDRNRHRHPIATLEFFGLEDGMSVLEIWPGSGWYTEILAPVLRDKGLFAVASWDPAVEGQPDYRYRLPLEMQAKFEANPSIYDKVEVIHYSPPATESLGQGRFNMILTFRNTHGWLRNGAAQGIYNDMAEALMPGGILGVVQHRADGDEVMTDHAGGYVTEATVISLAEKAGLEFVARSELNANPKDTKDHPEGVWTLPPSLRLDDVDREKYLAIGESDRMTLRFRKPGGLAALQMELD